MNSSHVPVFCILKFSLYICWSANETQRDLVGLLGKNPLCVPHFLFVGIGFLQPPWPSLNSKGQVQTVANQRKGGVGEIREEQLNRAASIQSERQVLQLTVTQIMSSLLQNSGLNWKKVGKTIRPFRYDLIQIPYDYTVEVRNRFKGLDLIDRVPDELWTEVHDIVQEAVIKTIPKKKELKKVKWLSEEAWQIAEKRREAKGKGEKERHTHLNAEFQSIARREKKAFFSDIAKK